MNLPYPAAAAYATIAAKLAAAEGDTDGGVQGAWAAVASWARRQLAVVDHTDGRTVVQLAKTIVSNSLAIASG